MNNWNTRNKWKSDISIKNIGKTVKEEWKHRAG